MPITYASTLYDSARAALEESVYDFLEASSADDLPTALEYATTKRAELVEDAKSSGWAWDESKGGLTRTYGWGVSTGGDEYADFDDDDIDRAFDAVATRLREEIAEAES